MVSADIYNAIEMEYINTKVRDMQSENNKLYMRCINDDGKPVSNCLRQEIMSCIGCKYLEVLKNEIYA